MNEQEILKGLQFRYRDRYRLLYDARLTPGVSAFLLVRLAQFVHTARSDYLAHGGDEDTLAAIEHGIHNERQAEVKS